jgi:hypothetical protein
MSEADVGYIPQARPPAQDAALAEYVDRELHEISRVLQSGILPLIRGQEWNRLPPRPRIGDLAYLAASIGQGGSEGWHEYVSQGGGTWQKL